MCETGQFNKAAPVVLTKDQTGTVENNIGKLAVREMYFVLLGPPMVVAPQCTKKAP